MRPGTFTVLFVAVVAVTFIAILPLRLALGWAAAAGNGLAADAVRGSLWAGVLEGATLHGVPIGDVRVRLDLVSLLAADPAFDLMSGEATMRVRLRDGAIEAPGA